MLELHIHDDLNGWQRHASFLLTDIVRLTPRRLTVRRIGGQEQSFDLAKARDWRITPTTQDPGG